MYVACLCFLFAIACFWLSVWLAQCSLALLAFSLRALCCLDFLTVQFRFGRLVFTVCFIDLLARLLRLCANVFSLCCFMVCFTVGCGSLSASIWYTVYVALLLTDRIYVCVTLMQTFAQRYNCVVGTETLIELLGINVCSWNLEDKFETCDLYLFSAGSKYLGLWWH